MPWTAKQQKVARAVQHGWKPKGEAKGFTKAFAEQVVVESNYDTGKKHKKGKK